MLGLPVHELLGGRKHDRLPAYATGGPEQLSAGQAQGEGRLLPLARVPRLQGRRGLARADARRREGYIPMRPTEAADFEGEKARVHARALRPGRRRSRSTGTWATTTRRGTSGSPRRSWRAVEPFDLFFFEEPLHYTDPWGYAELCRTTSVPIAGGECLTAAYEWRVFAEQDAFDIGQPDAAFTGGMLRVPAASPRCWTRAAARSPRTPWARAAASCRTSTSGSPRRTRSSSRSRPTTGRCTPRSSATRS